MESRSDTNANYAAGTGGEKGRRDAAGCCGAADGVFAGHRGLMLHGALLVLGAVFLLLPAFSTVTWFDESYSVALAAQPLGDLVSIAAADVHPPLYYLLLHAVYVLAGPNVVAYRLAGVAGAVALAALGLTHVRRDFGPRAGALFTLAACATPYLAYQAVQIRMYAWAAFAVTLCFLSALRILSAWRHGARPAASTWVAFALSSLAAAYLHYFGMLAAFILNASLLVVLVARLKRERRVPGDGASYGFALRAQLKVFLRQAALQVLAYVPWLVALVFQLAEKTNGRFWVTFVLPESLVQILTYPLASEQVAYWIEDPSVPLALRAGVAALITLALTLALVALVVGAVRASRVRVRVRVRAAARLACAVYLGTVVLAMLVSLAMGSLIVYYRYFSVMLGPVLVALAAVLSCVPARMHAAIGARAASSDALAVSHNARTGTVAKRPGKKGGRFNGGVPYPEHALPRFLRAARAFFLAVLIACGLLHQGLAVTQSYSAQNNAVFSYLEQTAARNAVNGTPLPVLSNDITVLGTAWAAGTNARLVYANFYDGYWNHAYACYEPGITSADTVAQAVGATEGAFLYLDIAQSPDSSVGTVKDPDAAVARMEELTGSRAVETRTFWRPYERRAYHVTLFEPVA